MILIGFQYHMMTTSQTELQLWYPQKRNRRVKFKTPVLQKQVLPVRPLLLLFGLGHQKRPAEQQPIPCPWYCSKPQALHSLFVCLLQLFTWPGLCTREGSALNCSLFPPAIVAVAATVPIIIKAETPVYGFK